MAITGLPAPPAIPLPRLILPDESLPAAPKEEHPHRRLERGIYVSAGILLVLGAGAFARDYVSRAEQPVSTPAAAAQPVAAAPQMAILELGGTLPSDATVSANGKMIDGDSISVSAGSYVLVASAPGRTTVTDTLEIASGRTVVWSPMLQLVPEKPAPRRARPPARSARSAQFERKQRELEAAIATEAAAIRRATERLRELGAAPTDSTRVAQGASDSGGRP